MAFVLFQKCAHLGVGIKEKNPLLLLVQLCMCVCMGAGGVGRKGGTLITPLQVCRRVAQATPHTCLVGSPQHYLGKIKN